MSSLSTVYKEKQFLVFQFDDKKTVKYDFATKTAIGKSGMHVKNLNNQLRNISMEDIIDKCSDKSYAKYLQYCQRCESSCYEISNIGTILSRVPRYTNYEQLFSAGVYNIERHFPYKLNDIPKALIKASKKYNLKITSTLVEYWKTYPNEYNLAFNLDYTSLTKEDVYKITTSYREYIRRNSSTVGYLLQKGYTMKALMMYMDYLKTFEALNNVASTLDELYDYVRMMSQISNKFDKYPRNFLTTHQIAIRNYERLKKEFNEELFKHTIDLTMECKIDDYVFVAPKCTQDIKDEAVAMNNCVASYIDKVINGECKILFMRKADDPTQSLVTLEVCSGLIVQAKRRYNTEITDADKKAIKKWESRYKNMNM